MGSETICPNCGALRAGSFCGICGQNDRDYTDSIWNVAKQALSELFEVDGRVARSLKTLFLNPGQLAVEFEANRRASFVSPIRLFLFTSLVWFFLFSISFPEPPEMRRDAPARSPADEIVVEVDLQDPEKLDDGLSVMRALVVHDRVRKLEDILRLPDGAYRKNAVLALAKSIQEEPDWTFMRSLAVNVIVDVTHSPTQLVEDTIDNLPLMMFVLLPWYSILLMLFYSGRGKRFAHHFVFAIHVHAFSFLVLSITALTPGGPQAAESGNVFWRVFDQVVTLALIIHTYFAFKKFYGDGIVRTLFKYAALGFFYIVGLVPAFILVIGYTVAGYF